MIDITDKANKPTLAQIDEYVANPLFGELCGHIASEYNAKYEIMHSGDNVLLGWNVRFYKSGRTLCRLYPREQSFFALIVIGQKEKERAEAALPQMTQEMREAYCGTKEGMGQRWLVLKFDEHNALYEDLLTLINLRCGR